MYNNLRCVIYGRGIRVNGGCHNLLGNLINGRGGGRIFSEEKVQVFQSLAQRIVQTGNSRSRCNVIMAQKTFQFGSHIRLNIFYLKMKRNRIVFVNKECNFSFQ